MKILVIRFSSIGDIVLASPVLRCIKKQIPDVELHFLSKLSFKMVTAANPYVDKFFYYDKSLDTVIESLRVEDYDYVIDLQNNIRSNRIRRAIKRPSYIINKLSLQKFILTKLRINVMPKTHITQRSLQAVAKLGVKDDGGGLDYFIPAEDVVKDSELPASHLFGYIAIVIGASYFTKKLPVHKLQQLCKAIDYPIILIGGNEDQEAGKAIASIDTYKIYNACGKFNLNESADLVRRSKLVISHDTGLQYIACAFNKQVLAIWGGTSPKLAVEPYYGEHFIKQQATPVFENICLNLPCQPCSKYGTNRCPKGHFNCMEKLDVEEVAKKAMQRI